MTSFRDIKIRLDIQGDGAKEANKRYRATLHWNNQSVERCYPGTPGGLLLAHEFLRRAIIYFIPREEQFAHNINRRIDEEEYDEDEQLWYASSLEFSSNDLDSPKYLGDDRCRFLSVEQLLNLGFDPKQVDPKPRMQRRKTLQPSDSESDSDTSSSGSNSSSSSTDEPPVQQDTSSSSSDEQEEEQTNEQQIDDSSDSMDSTSSSSEEQEEQQHQEEQDESSSDQYEFVKPSRQVKRPIETNSSSEDEEEQDEKRPELYKVIQVRPVPKAKRQRI